MRHSKVDMVRLMDEWYHYDHRCSQCLFEICKAKSFSQPRDFADKTVRELDVFVRSQFLLPVLNIQLSFFFVWVVKFARKIIMSRCRGKATEEL